MKDIDFDELDRAVGSVLSGKKSTKKAAPAKSSAKAADEPKPAEEKAASTVTPTESTTAAETKPVTRTATASARRAAPALRRSSGRFMDVVHPSSDMKTQLPTSRGRTVITPLSSDSSDAETTQAPVPSAVPEAEATPQVADDATPVPASEEVVTAPTTPDVTPTPPEPTPAATTPGTSEPSWPDPLEVMGTKTTEESTAEESVALPNDVPVETPVPAVEGMEAGQTPFLTDAKVDKRPLGAFGVPGEDEEVVEAGHPEDMATSFGAPVPEPEAATNVAKPLPPELQPDAVEAESQEIAEEPEAPESDAAPVPPKETAPAPTEAAPVLSQSIAPQYRPADDADDTDDHVTSSLFDTEQYHQPLAATKAKGSRLKRAMVTILMVILLLIVGAGIGYAAYLYSISS